MNSTFFPWSNFVYYTLMNILGHFFVNSSNLNMYRKSLIATRSNPGGLDFILCIVFAPIFWIFSSIMVLRAPENLSSTGDGSYRYPWYNVFMYNLFAWTIPYFFGL